MNRLTRNLILSSFIGTFAEELLVPIWSTFVLRVGGNILDAGIGFAVFNIVTGIIILLCGKWNWYKNNYRLVVFLGFTISGVGEFSYLLVSNTWELFIVQTIIGVATGLLGPAWDSLYETNNREDKWSFWDGGASILVGLAALVSGFIVFYFTFNVLFILMGCIDIVAMIYAYCVWRS